MKLDRQHIALGAIFGMLALSVFLAVPQAIGTQNESAVTPEDHVATPTEPSNRSQPSPYIRASDIVQQNGARRLPLRSGVALVMDNREGVMLYERNADQQRPIASLTKLMTALVVLDAGLPLNEAIAIGKEDRDTLRGSHSRLPFGSIFTRLDILHAALAASDNRAAAALARTYPGGKEAFVQAMNAKAQQLNMLSTRYADASGLDSNNVSTARDLAKLMAVVDKHPLFHQLTTTASFGVTDLRTGKQIAFVNTNRLARSDSWEIELSKTGYTAAAGNCIAMQTTINSRPLTIVLLNSWGKLDKFGDSVRIRDWLTKTERRISTQHQVVARIES
jgi:D-alanyl-D-alanine endopeptidase (penicillin-binding protein 7)